MIICLDHRSIFSSREQNEYAANIFFVKDRFITNQNKVIYANRAESKQNSRSDAFSLTSYVGKHGEELSPHRKERMPSQQTEKQRQTDEIRLRRYDTLRKSAYTSKNSFHYESNDQSAS